MPSSFAAVPESEISPVPPIRVILAPGIRAEPSDVEGEVNCVVPAVFTVLVKDGATNDGVSVPMQGASGRMSGDAAAEVAPIELAAADAALDVVDDGIEPVVGGGAEPHTVETLEVPDVGAPDVACMPDIAVEPLP